MKLILLFIILFIKNSIIVAKTNTTTSPTVKKQIFVLENKISDYDRKTLKKKEAFIFYQKEFKNISNLIEKLLLPYISTVTFHLLDNGLTVRKIYRTPEYAKKAHEKRQYKLFIITVSRQPKFENIDNDGTATNKIDVVFSNEQVWAARVTAINTNIVLPMGSESDSDLVKKFSLGLALTTLFKASVQTANIDDEMKNLVPSHKSKEETLWPVMLIVGLYIGAVTVLIGLYCYRRRSDKNEQAEEKSSMLKPQANGIDDDFDIEFVDE